MRAILPNRPTSYSPQRGFTIVELLIVIVVIGILATISIVSYRGVQEQARDAVRESALRTITNGLELYRLDAGHYPNACNSFNTGCAIANLSTDLTPMPLNAIPRDPGPGQTMSYVVGGEATLWGRNYGMYVKYEAREPCKYLRGENPPSGWWPDAPECVL